MALHPPQLVLFSRLLLSMATEIRVFVLALSASHSLIPGRTLFVIGLTGRCFIDEPSALPDGLEYE
jgi:hypothetical protein